MTDTHTRADWVLMALGKRMSRCGDMPIRVSRATMRVLLVSVGLRDWEVGEDRFREVDALALDMLRYLAVQTMADTERLCERVRGYRAALSEARR